MGSNDNYFREIIDSIPAGIILVDGEGNVSYSNRKADEMVGKMDGNLLKSEIFEDMANRKKIEELIKNGKTFRNETLKKNERFFSIDGISLRGNSIILINDVSERIRAENALKENERKYRLLTESSPAGIVMLRNSSCVFSNKKFKEIIGSERIDNRKITDFVHAGDIALLKQKMKEAMAGKNTSSFTIRLIGRDGKISWVEMNLCSVNDGSEKEMLINMVDITEKKKVEEELDISNKKMEEIIEREKKFIEDISHYFFNPLCIAKGYIDLSLKDASPGIRKKLEITRTAVDRVETVVKHIVMEGRIYE